MSGSRNDAKTRSSKDGFIKLGQAISIISGAPFKSELFNDIGNGLPLIRVRDVNTGPAGVFYSGEYSKEHLVSNGDLLVSMDGDFKAVRWSYGDGLLNQRVCKVVPKDEVLHRHYLEQFLPKALSDIHRETTFTTVKHLSTKTIREIEIPLPPLDDQRRIAHLLGKVEGLIARRKQHLQQLDDLLKSVFLEMFGDPVRNEKGWDKKPLSNIATVRIGPFGSLLHAEDYISDGIPLVNPSHMVNGEIVVDESLTITEEKFKELSAYHLRLNDVVVARRGEIGRCAMVRYKSKLLCGTGSMFIRVKGEYLPIMLQFMIYRTSLKDYLESNAKGVTMKNLNSSILEKMQVIVPPINLQNQFATIVEKVEALKSRYQQSLTDLETLYGALSQKAFKGELDLSRVVLPAEAPEIFEEKKIDVEKKQPLEPSFELPAPEELTVLQTAGGPKSLLGEWLNAWLKQLGNAPFVAQDFMDAARQRLWELSKDDAPNWGAVEYDELKAWVFKKIASGKIKQTRNIISINEKKQFGNQVILRSRKSRL